GLRAAVDRNRQSRPGSRKGLQVYLPAARLVRLVSDPFSVGGKLGIAFFEIRSHHRKGFLIASHPQGPDIHARPAPPPPRAPRYQRPSWDRDAGGARTGHRATSP